MSKLSLLILGPFQASLGTERVSDFRTRKVQALLVYLATDPAPHSRDRLLDLLWPGHCGFLGLSSTFCTTAWFSSPCW